MRRVKHMIAVVLTLASAPVMAQTPGGSGSFGNPLVDAVDRGDEGAVNNLLKYGQYIDSRGDFGTTPLMRAAYRGNASLAELLIKAGASVNATDVGGAAPLHIAARQGHADVVDVLIRYNADVNLPDGEGWTPLMRASNAGQTTIADRLITAGANIDKQNEWGETALVYAIKAGDAGLVRTLVQKGANLDVTDADGVSARQLARRKGNAQVLAAIDGPAAAPVTAPVMPEPVAITPPPVAPIIASTTSSPVAALPAGLPEPASNVPVVRDSRRTMVLGGGTAALDNAPTPPVASMNANVKDYRGASSGKGFMLQVGAFIASRDGDYRQIGDSHWQRLRTAYSASLQGLDPYIGGTPLEGTDQSLYRIRAGFIPDLKQAEQACGTIREMGGTCMVITPAILEQEQHSSVEDRFFKEVALASAARTGKDPEVALREVETRKNQPPEAVLAAAAPQPQPETPWQVIEPEKRPAELAAPTPAVQVAEAAPLPAPPSALPARKKPLKPQAVASAKVPETVMLLQDPTRPAPKPAPLKPLTIAGDGAAPKPRVEVAEAIQVPLNYGARGGNVTTLNRPGPMGGRRNTTMIEISAFSSQNAAISYAERLKASVGDAASGMSVRVTSPLTARGKYYKVLMGPVSSDDQVGAICRTARADQLTCNTMRQLGSSGVVLPGRAFANIQPALQAGETGEHWLMLGAFASTEEAKQHFVRLTSADKTLRGKESRISRPEQRRGSSPLRYRLHAGPFSNMNEANKVCSRLEKQDHFCTVI